MNKELSLYLRKMVNINNRAILEFNRSLNGELSPINIFIIKYISENKNKDIFQVDIEKRFFMKKSTVSKLLSNMEERDLIIREAVAKDARYKKLVLGEKAEKMNRKIKQDENKIITKLFENIGEGELKIFGEVLDKISENLDKEF